MTMPLWCDLEDEYDDEPDYSRKSLVVSHWSLAKSYGLTTKDCDCDEPRELCECEEYDQGGTDRFELVE